MNRDVPLLRSRKRPVGLSRVRGEALGFQFRRTEALPIGLLGGFFRSGLLWVDAVTWVRLARFVTADAPVSRQRHFGCPELLVLANLFPPLCMLPARNRVRTSETEARITYSTLVSTRSHNSRD